MGRTVADTTANETGDGEDTVEDTVGGVGERDVAETTGSEVGDCAEHADGGKAGRDICMRRVSRTEQGGRGLTR